MKITDFFDKTFCVNLERRSDRWDECLTEFEISHTGKWDSNWNLFKLYPSHSRP